MILHLLRHFVGDAFNSLSTLHVYPLLIVFILCPPLSPPLGVTHDPHRINLLIPSSLCHIESRQSHRWAQRRQTARTMTPCSRSTCSTARGSSSPATLKYFELWSHFYCICICIVSILKYFEHCCGSSSPAILKYFEMLKHCSFPPESFRHFNVGIFNKKALNLNFSMLALPIVHQTPGN